MLSWQKSPIHKSLLQSSKKHSSDAVGVFKKILAFMGDAPEQSKKNPSLVASEILAIGIKLPPLRDEIYCQLCKQTKLNPEPLSAAAGWRLLTLACSAFAPTRGFQEHLYKYFLENHHAPSIQEAQILSRYCSWKLSKTIATGPDEKLTLAQVEDWSLRGVRSYQVLFPAELEYLSYCQSFEKNPVAGDSGVPEIVIQMCNLIRKAGGFSAKGIFRIAAQREHIHAARSKIEAGNYSGLDQTDCHTPADVLKHWLRELANPLVPLSLYDAALKASDNEEACVAIVRRDMVNLNLPAHVATMEYLLKFLAELATHQKETMMSEENLAIVFSQDLLRTVEKDPVLLYKNSVLEKNFVRSLILAWGKQKQ